MTLDLSQIPNWLVNGGGFTLLVYLLKKYVHTIEGKLTTLDTSMQQLLSSINAHDTRMAVLESRQSRAESDIAMLHGRVTRLATDKLFPEGNGK